MEQDFLINLEPDVYYITDHYRGSPYVLVRLAHVHPDDMRRLFEQAWRRVASKHLIAEYEHSLSGDSTT